MCTLDVTTRAELKAAVDACVGDRFCEGTMPHWDVSRVTDMSFLFQGKTQFNVDISQWEMSQVTNVQGMFHGAARFDQNIGQWEMSQVMDARGMFDGASSFLQDITGWTLASGADTTGMFTGADTWLFRVSRDDSLDTTDGPPDAWSFDLCLKHERVKLGLCVRCTGGGLRAAGDDPTLGVDTECAFPDRTALKAAVDNCIAVDSTGVACCSHGADCGAAGTAEMAGLGRVAGDEHERACSTAKGPSTRIYRDGTPRASRTCTGCSIGACLTRSTQDIGTWDTSSVTTMSDVLPGLRVQPAPIEMGRQLGHDHEDMFVQTQRIQHHAGGLGHIQSHGFL